MVDIVVPKKRRGLLKPKVQLSRKQEAAMVARLVEIIQEPPEPLLCKHCDNGLICVKCGEEAKTRRAAPFDLQNWALRRELEKTHRRLLATQRGERHYRGVAESLQKSIELVRKDSERFREELANKISAASTPIPPIKPLEPPVAVGMAPGTIIKTPPLLRKKAWWWPW